MRFPIDPPEPVNFAEDLYEIQQAAGIRPLQALNPRPQPPSLPLRRETPQQRQAREDSRTREDRRQQDRRKQAQKVLVDTRLGRERRHSRRRPDDPPPPGIDEKA